MEQTAKQTLGAQTDNEEKWNKTAFVHSHYNKNLIVTLFLFSPQTLVYSSYSLLKTNNRNFFLFLVAFNYIFSYLRYEWQLQLYCSLFVFYHTF